ncbi:E3 ubiquitin-protein ligase DCST1 [Cololabis saira]|uniref:E3 ubiquitin-protein ligase DCST1 n=1 Tax=Cololabis saira TaxID=129043 RepID=UPI002AD356E1|nr:E3 ubiquitin-protein ligase DCST1 [Cololabis saira]
MDLSDPQTRSNRTRPGFLQPVQRLLQGRFLHGRFLQGRFQRFQRFPGVQLLLRGLFGAVSGAALFLGVSHSLPLTFSLKLAAAFLFVGVCAAGAALSSSFRCSVLLVFPSMLGSRGRAYLMLLIMSVLHAGPVSNIRQNAEAAALSLSCNLDLQVRHGRLLWRHAIQPYVRVTQELMDDKPGFESEARSASSNFQSIRDEVVLQYGYDRFQPQPSGGNSSTQEQFSSKTRMQCDSVVQEGVQRCTDWFSSRWSDCMEAIPVPVINHVFCFSMKFHFLCDVMRVMTPWCRENIPVEGNFGPLFDQLNVSVDQLSREFSTELLVEQQQQQSVLDGSLLDQNFTQAVRDSFQNLRSTTGRLVGILQTLLSLTFISMFYQAFSYLRSYQRDICFDNVYITSYFRRIDARRRRAGKVFLLPLRKSERNQLIRPWSPRIHPEELRQVGSGLVQVVSVSLLSFLLLAVDFAVFHVLDIVSRNTITQFNVTSHHQVDIRVGGASMLARLLRTTVSAFNSSNHLDIQTDNQACRFPPAPLPADVYLTCVCCLLLLLMFSFLQVYSSRLRRAVTASYHPKREKKRVLFLYNLQLHRKVSRGDRKRVVGRGRARTVFQRLSRWWRHLLPRHQQGAPDSEEPRYACG